ncbi:MAG TPA: hypothetical protein ENK82_02150 [Campylobacterales bacterium]|nr:hypothetical protein [Campylobacterales bacterium]HHS92126.1 hypothetical protein [Campylobacterales bacterium]
MLFNEIIDEHGLETVSEKTNISTVNLGYLLEEDFSKLNRVKALGFLLIFEREYKDIDVSDFREKIKTYYDEHRPSDDKVVMVAKDSVEGSGSFSFFKLFIVLALIGGGFYLYQDGKLDSIMQNIGEKDEFFDDKKALESNITEADANKVVVDKSEKQSVTIEVTAPLSHEKNDTKSATQITKLASVNSVETNQTTQSVVKEVSEEFLANEANSPLAANVNEENSSVVNTITTVSVNPNRGMLWFGFINLDTKKRREFMKKVSTPFNIDENRWLLVTGHGYFDLISDEKTVELSDNKKHYFYIDSSEIREIGKKEFRELNGNRGW